jgi:hypothetical protein
MRTAAAALCLALAFGGSAFAAEVHSDHCSPISIPKNAVEARTGGKWISLTTDQWQFLRGIYAMNPLTPPGLPYGDRAVLAKVDGNDGALVFFIDGDKACTPMAVPAKLLHMLDAVAMGWTEHEGAGL